MSLSRASRNAATPNLRFCVNDQSTPASAGERLHGGRERIGVAEQRRVGLVEQAAGSAVGGARIGRRADTEEELLAHTDVPLAARGGVPGVLDRRSDHVAVAGVSRAE